MSVNFIKRSERMRNSSFYNSEGYPDPTHYYAEKNIEKKEREKLRALHQYRPIVYICSPFSGDVKENKKKARTYSRYAVKKGYLPITPHLLFPQFLDDSDPDEREVGLFMGTVLITKCVEFWVFGETRSEGMKREIKKAKLRGIKIRYFTSDLQEVK